MSESAAPAKHFALPKADPNTILGGVLLALLATAGFFYVNILSAIVSGLIDGLGASEREAGFVASANVYGASLGAFGAVFIVRRAPWRLFALGALTLLIAIDLLSAATTAIESLIAIRFVHGMVGGALVGMSYGLFSRTKSPDRVFGILLCVQYGLGGLGVMTLPRLVPLFGHQVLFLALAAFSMTALVAMQFLPDMARTPNDDPPKQAGRALWAPLSLTLAAIFMFQAGNMGIAAYMIELGRFFDLQDDLITGTLGIAGWISIGGAVLVVTVGLRFGRWRLFAVALTGAVAGTLAFHFSGDARIFAAANAGTGILWAFVIAYLFGMCAEFDRSGTSAALGGFVSKLGLATGPALAGVLAERHDYTLLINTSALALLLSAFIMLGPALTLDRARAAKAV